MFNLVKRSTLPSPTSVITEVAALSNDFNSRELLIVLPEEPFRLLDLKKGYDAIQNVGCCFNIELSKDRIRIIETKSRKKGIHVVEFSEASAESDRQFFVYSYAFEIYDDFSSAFAPSSEKSPTFAATIYRKSCTNCSQKDCVICSLVGLKGDYKCNDCFILSNLK